MNKQQLYNAIATHLLTQKVASIAPNSSGDRSVCMYRGPNQLKCAIGGIMPDRVYKPEFDAHDRGLPVDELPRKVLRVMGIRTDACIGLASDMQNVHDQEKPSEWTEALVTVANNHNLDWGVLTDLDKQYFVDLQAKVDGKFFGQLSKD